MQRQIDEGNGEQKTVGATPIKNPKERVDSEQVAQAALDKARNTLELRDYLDKQKTDWDRMEEMRKKMDQQVAELDQNLAQLEQPKKAD
jgi:wobble nucleotide-excising tRNase